MTSNQNQQTTHLTIHTDGACTGNPGPGGVGVVIQFWNEETKGERLRLSYGQREVTTNNRMELSAAIYALEVVSSRSDIDANTPMTLHSDSQLVINGITKWIKNWKRNGWRKADTKPVMNADLWNILDDLTAHFPKLSFSWVRGHNGDPDNEEADALATSAIPQA